MTGSSEPQNEPPALQASGQDARVLTAGLTGGIASGKSTVDAMFAALGAHIIDADRIVHALLGPGGGATRAVLEAFGASVAAADGGVDRSALGAIVFSDAAARARLEAIVHPLVTRKTNDEIEAYARTGNGPIVIIDAALLVETGGDRRFDRLIVVVCSEETQIERLVSMRGLTRPQALARIRAQATAMEKAARADYRIDTDCPLGQTQARVAEVYQALLKEHEGKKGSWKQPRRD